LNYGIESEEILYGSYFFLSDTRTDHHRDVYNIMNLLAQVGGVYSALFAVFGLIGGFINT